MGSYLLFPDGFFFSRHVHGGVAAPIPHEENAFVKQEVLEPAASNKASNCRAEQQTNPLTISTCGAPHQLGYSWLSYRRVVPYAPFDLRLTPLRSHCDVFWWCETFAELYLMTSRPVGRLQFPIWRGRLASSFIRMQL